MPIRTRFAPSPTGVLHLGSIRTALFCWLYARHHGGDFILRIEDTDRERSTPENVEAILDGLSWLGLHPDEGPYFQSERFARYRDVTSQLLESEKAYYCYCTRDELEEMRAGQLARAEHVRYDGRCRDRKTARQGMDPVVRFKNPKEGKVVVHDQIHGTVIFDNAQLDDLIIARSDGSPTYNFTVVVDDADMDISHVIRGDDHLNNTPRQVNLFDAIGRKPPFFAHLPMILGPDGAKLSKRHGAVDIREYREQGYLPEALLNYLARLGWSHGNQEIFSIDELISLFDVSEVNVSASAFNPEKLLWLNQQYIKSMPSERLGALLRPYLELAGLDPNSGPPPEEVADGFRERAETLLHMAANARYCYEDFEVLEPLAVKKYLRPVVLEPLKSVRASLGELGIWSSGEIGRIIRDTADAYGLALGKLGQPIRVAVTSGPVSPPIDVTVYLIGRERTLDRLGRAISLIEARLAAAED